MRLSLAAALLALTLAPSTWAEQTPFNLPPSTSLTANFTGQKVIRFSTSSPLQHKELLSQAHLLGLDVWAVHLGHTCGSNYGCVDIRIAAYTHDEDPFRVSASAEELMSQLLQPFVADAPVGKTLIEDLGDLVAQSQQGSEAKAGGGTLQDWHRDYHNFEEIEAYMRTLESAYQGYVKVEELGRTHEGRPILALKISKDVSTTPPPPPPTDPTPEPPTASSAKLGILITGGQHAREWISTSSSLYFASDLLSAALGPPTNTTSPFKRKKNRRNPTWSKTSALSILSTFTLTVVPVANPDGYAYTWTHNRMWRKNRQPNPLPGGLFCKGVDLNRNWDYAFDNAGRSCSEMYPGNAAFSAAETKAISAYMEDNNVRGYFDLHSYGQLLMYPFSHSCEESVADEEDLLELSLGAVSAAKKVGGKKYTAGKVCSVYAEAGGNSVDWSYGKGVKWSYSVELRDGGTYGFLLPPKQIRGASEEVGAALAYMLEFIAKKDRLR